MGEDIVSSRVAGNELLHLDGIKSSKTRRRVLGRQWKPKAILSNSAFLHAADVSFLIAGSQLVEKRRFTT
jgi:hypothetical protein